MANRTVYPYGSDGQLPSSIGIINDLKTGGADKALSAEMGKDIGDYLFDKWENIDLTGVTISSYGLAWTASGLHFVVPVTPGEKLKITVTSTQNTGGFWAFFTDSYTPPTTTSDTVPFAPGTTRNWLNNGTTERIVPQGAAYICCTTRDGTNKNSSWTLQRLIESGISDDYVKTDSELIKAYGRENVDMGSLTKVSCSLGSSGSWINNNGCNHVVIPVTPGLKVKIRSTYSVGGGNFYGFLTSSYATPTSGQSIPYANGGNRIWRSDSSGWGEVFCPAESAYLCLVTRNGDGQTTIWEVVLEPQGYTSEIMEEYVFMKGDVVNNLTSGGVDIPLSAEQGKVLNGKFSDYFPPDVTRHQYNGPLVKVNNTHFVGTKKVATIGANYIQGGDCFSDYLFLFREGNDVCFIYNLATGSLVQQISIPASERGFVSTCHCNTVNFSTEYYDAEDPFPLLYVSTGYAAGGYTGALVYRVVATTENDTTTYALSLVQTIKIPDPGWSEFVIGDDGDCYVYRFTVIYRMKLPALSEGDVILDFEEALNVYHFAPQPAWYQGARGQGMLYHCGKIYGLLGVPASGEKSLFLAYNLTTQTRDVEIDLNATLGLTAEPEALFIWQGHFCMAFRSYAGVYALYFD